MLLPGFPVLLGVAQTAVVTFTGTSGPGVHSTGTRTGFVSDQDTVGRPTPDPFHAGLAVPFRMIDELHQDNSQRLAEIIFDGGNYGGAVGSGAVMQKMASFAEVILNGIRIPIIWDEFHSYTYCRKASNSVAGNQFSTSNTFFGFVAGTNTIQWTT